MKRLLAVIFGFFAAMLTAFVTLFWVGGSWATREVQSQIENGQGYYDFSEIIGALAFAIQVAPFLTLLPALVAVILGEVLKIRSLLYYVAAGGIAAALMPLAVRNVADAQAYAPSAQYLTILATAGFAAGFVYWLIAGRRA